MATGTIRTTDYMVNTAFATNTSGAIGADDAQDGAESAGSLPLAASSPITATNYTAVIADRNCLVECNNTDSPTVSVTFIIPTNASVAFPIGTFLHVRQTGTPQVNIVGAAGVTVNSATGTSTTRTQYSRVSAHKSATNTWVLEGDLS